jgi:proline iminopeptidase
MKKLVFAGAAIGAGVIAYRELVRPWWRSWGIDGRDTVRALPGDELVPDAPVMDTRSIEIAAPPSDVWPWLLQMGYGRAGWYSYDTIDMVGASSRRIVPEWQVLAVGDVVPTHPGGGFLVRDLQPERALVLYSDTGIVAGQAAATRDAASEAATANVQAAGAFLGATQPTDFAASWAFVLEPVEGGRTRLIERFRVRFGAGGPQFRVIGPIMGFGVFVMMRRQMLGIRDRAIVTAVAPRLPEPVTAKPERTPANGRVSDPTARTEVLVAAI